MKKENNVSFLNGCLIFVGIFLVLFVIAMIITFWKYQSVPDVLVTGVLGTGIGEAIIAGLITIAGKIFDKNKEDEESGTDDTIRVEGFVAGDTSDECHG